MDPRKGREKDLSGSKSELNSLISLFANVAVPFRDWPQFPPVRPVEKSRPKKARSRVVAGIAIVLAVGRRAIGGLRTAKPGN
jgi:hypothetical protein